MPALTTMCSPSSSIQSLLLLPLDPPSLPTYAALRKAYSESDVKDVSAGLRAELARSRIRVGSALASAFVRLPDDVHVHVTTWNAGNQVPRGREEMEALIPTRKKDLYDFVVVGLQECDFELSVEMSAMANEHRVRRKAQKADMMGLTGKQGWSQSQKGKVGGVSEDVEDEYFDMDSPEQTLKNTVTAQPGLASVFSMAAKSAETNAKHAVTSRAGAYVASLLLEHLGEDNYFLVRESELMQMRLFVFSLHEHRARITHVEKASEGTGIGRFVGNKGGVAISLRYQDIRFCFISTHLAAHRPFVAERNRDSQAVLNMIQRKLGTKASSYLSDWDYVFFIGDLNYRLGKSNVLLEESQSSGGSTSLNGSSSTELHQSLDDSGGGLDTTIELDDDEEEDGITSNPNKKNSDQAIKSSPSTSSNLTAGALSQSQKKKFSKKKDHTSEERAKIMDLIDSCRWGDLMELDQLCEEQKSQRVLVGFKEAAIYPFPPTFKVARKQGGVTEYNDKRLPSYCDRILWHTTPSLARLDPPVVIQKTLFSPCDVSTSDHKPVCSTFRINANVGAFVIPPRPAALETAPSGLSNKSSPPRRFLYSDGEKRSLFGSRVLEGGMQILLSQLTANDLIPAGDLNGLADPYIVVYSTDVFLSEERGSEPDKGAARTKVVFGKLSCSWDETLLIRTPARFSEGESLYGKSLTISLWDFDTLSRDDAMGEVVLCLNDLVTAMMKNSGLFYSDTAIAAQDVSPNAMGPMSSPTNSEPRTRKTERFQPMIEHVLANGRLIKFKRRQVAFSLPIIRDGRKAGTLSGVASMHMPWERIRVPRSFLSTDFGCGWKCTAYLEQFKPTPMTPRFSLAHRTAAPAVDEKPTSS